MTGLFNITHVKTNDISVLQTKLTVDNLSHDPIVMEYELKLFDKKGKTDVIKGRLHVKSGKSQIFDLQDLQLSEKEAKKISHYELIIKAKSG